jgi:competence protein ComEC
MKFQRFPFVRFGLFFALGVVCRHYLGEAVLLPVAILPVLLVVYIWLLWQSSHSNRHVLAILSFLLLFNLGGYRLSMFLMAPEEFPHQTEGYIGQLIQEPQVKDNTVRVVIELSELKTDVGWRSAKGRVNAYFSKEAGQTLSYGDVVWIEGKPAHTTAPANPGEFDYRNYLAYQNIHYQQFVGHNFSLLRSGTPNWFVAKSLLVRDFCVGQVGKYIVNPKSRAVVLALVLGVKDELDNELIASFSATGAMHVLAVSGLHVGIIYLIFFGLVKQVRLNRKKYRWWLAIASLMVLWSYALLTGLSPSVLRAVTMFSFVALGKALFRGGNIYNTLSLSALVLLLYNPYLIMSVGFQLSFLAVFGIVYLHPKLYGLWQPRHWLADKVWSITCVSVAAQLATGPLSMLYFHQFPTYFLVSNLFIIPAATLILVGGLGLLALSFWSAVATLLGVMLNGTVVAVNWLVTQVSHFPGSTIDGVYLSILDAWLLYAVLIGVVLFWELHRKSYLQFALAMALAFVLSQTYHFAPYQRSYEFSVIDASRQSVMDFRHGFQSKVLADEVFLADPESQQFSLHGKRLISGAKQGVANDELTLASASFPGGSLTVFEGKTILWLNESADIHWWSKVQIPVDYLVLSGNAISRTEQLEHFSHVQYIVLDKSNSRWVSRYLTLAAKEMGIPVHQVATNGYFSSLWKR